MLHVLLLDYIFYIQVLYLVIKTHDVLSLSIFEINRCRGQMLYCLPISNNVDMKQMTNKNFVKFYCK